jgi:DNA-binding MarR family transcriptional regulator
VPRLEEAGLLSRQPDPRDGRVWRVETTRQGGELLERVRSERNDALSSLLAGLDEASQQAIATATPVLEALAERLRDQATLEGPRR